MGLFGLLTGSDPDPLGVFGKKGSYDPLSKNNRIPYLQRPRSEDAVYPDMNSAAYRALLGEAGVPSSVFNNQSPFSALAAFSGRQGPSQSAPVLSPENLSSIFAGAGPYMQQALALAGQQQPVHAPPPQQGSTWNPPPGVHVAPPYTNPYMGEQWLGALSGIGM